jgi:hypothetical protein
MVFAKPVGRSCDHSGFTPASQIPEPLYGFYENADMPIRYFLSIALLAIIFTQTALSQDRKSDKDFKEYSTSILRANVDTIVVLKSGCTGCEVRYEDEQKHNVGEQTIYVLTKKSGQFKVAIFDDIISPIYFTTDTCSLFDTIQHYKSVLNSKDPFYKKELAELSKSNFFRPRPIHYAFDELIITLPEFKYEFLVIGENADYLGFVRQNENWFLVTKAFIEYLNNYCQSIKN